MKIKEIEKELEKTTKIKFKGECHDCGKEIIISCFRDGDKLVIEGGAIYSLKMGTPPTEHRFFKCDKCFKKDKILRNYQECEVWSRVVGYLRPVNQWNKGKLEEYKQRKEYQIEK